MVRLGHQTSGSCDLILDPSTYKLANSSSAPPRLITAEQLHWGDKAPHNSVTWRCAQGWAACCGRSGWHLSIYPQLVSQGVIKLWCSEPNCSNLDHQARTWRCQKCGACFTDRAVMERTLLLCLACDNPVSRQWWCCWQFLWRLYYWCLYSEGVFLAVCYKLSTSFSDVTVSLDFINLMLYKACFSGINMSLAWITLIAGGAGVWWSGFFLLAELLQWNGLAPAGHRGGPRSL